MKKGFTLVEILIVLVIITTLAVVIVPRMTSQIGRAKIGAAFQMIGLMRRTLDGKYDRTGQFPTASAWYFPPFISYSSNSAGQISGDFQPAGISNSDMQQSRDFYYSLTSTSTAYTLVFMSYPSSDPLTYAYMSLSVVGSNAPSYSCLGLLATDNASNPCRVD